MRTVPPTERPEQDARAAIWHNETTHQHPARNLTAYDLTAYDH